MASRGRASRQQGSNSAGAGSQVDDVEASREILQQYAAGKKFRVKYLGSNDIEDYRNKRETSSIMAELKKRSTKAPKPKAIISLFSRELVVMDEKSKTVTMKVPVQKLKFVCHDKHDSSLFGVILATDRITSDSQRLHRLFCYQADSKISTSFVHSVNTLFQALGVVMRERRRRAEESNGSSASGGGAVRGASATSSDRARSTGGVASSTGGGASSTGGGASSSGSGAGATRSPNQSSSTAQQKPSTDGDPMSDDERYEPVPLGFGIEAAPPSYRAAISKKNEAIFKKPDDIVTTVNTRLPPPPPGARPKKQAAPLPAQRTTPTTAPPQLPGPPPSSSRSNAPSIAPPTARPRHATTTTTTAAAVSASSASQRPAVANSATSLPLPQVPESVDGRVSGSGGAAAVATFSVGGGPDEGGEGSVDPSAEGNIYDVPTNNMAAPPNQEQRQAVWQEWQALESELQTIAQDLGFDMDSGTVGIGATAALPPIEDLNITSPGVASGVGFDVTESFASSAGDDPFADDFFQTSFGSSTVSVSMQAAWPESVSSIDQVEDPFAETPSFVMREPVPQVNGISASAADPFQESVTTSIDSQAATASDPFQDNTPTPTSAPVSFDFASFSAQSLWGESNATTVTTSTAQVEAPTSTFEGFGTDWNAFDSDPSFTTTPSSSSLNTSQPLAKKASQPESSFSPPLPDSSTTPRQTDITSTPPPSQPSGENGFGADWSAMTTNTVTTATSAMSARPPVITKRDSASLLPPPVLPPRRADALSDRNQSFSSSSSSTRSRPRPSADHATVAATSGQVILNRPAKSKTSPGQDQTEVPVSSNQGGVSAPGMTTGTASDLFQNGIPQPATTQAPVGDLFQESVPQAATPSGGQAAAIPSNSQVAVSGPFENSSPTPEVVSTSQSTVSDPFLEDVAPAATLPISQSVASNPFLDVSPPAGAAQTSVTVAGDLFGEGFLPAPNLSDLNPAQPKGSPFQKGVPLPSTENPVLSASSSAAKSGAGENAWSSFGDVGTTRQETAPSDWSAFGSTSAGKEVSTNQEPSAWSAFDMGSQKVEQPASSDFGFGDDWNASSGGGRSATPSSQTQPATTNTIQKTNTPAAVKSTPTQKKTDLNWEAFGQGSNSVSTPLSSGQPQRSQQKTSQVVVVGIAAPPLGKASRGSNSPKSSRSRPRGRPSTDRAQESIGGINPPASSVKGGASQSSIGSASAASKSSMEPASTPTKKSESAMKTSSSYLDDLSSVSVQPQFPPMPMNYQPGGGPAFPTGAWGSPSGPAQPPFSQQQQPGKFPYGPSQGGGQGTPLQQQQQQQQQQFSQQQQAMFMQQQQAMRMQQGPGPMQQGPGPFQQGPGPMQQVPGPMQQGPGPMQQVPGPIQQGPVPMQQGPGPFQQGPGPMQQVPVPMQQGRGPMQRVPGPIQQGPGPMQMQQGPMGPQFQSPGQPQMMAAGQMQPPHFSTPQQQANFYQQQQFQQNPNHFSPIGQQPNPLTPGNTSVNQLSVSGGSNLSTSKLYTSDFSSPPYAVGSSTPQSDNSASPPPPPTIEYRPSVGDGRSDPFAALVTGALSPSKDGKVKAVDAEKLKAAFRKQPTPSPGFPVSPYSNTPGSMNAQGGWF